MDTTTFVTWWRLLVNVAITVGALLSFVVFVEVIRAIVFLYALSPWLGVPFALLVFSGSAWLVGRFVIAMLRLPRAPAPPEVRDANRLTQSEALACGRYMQHRILQLRANPRLSPENLVALHTISEQLHDGADEQAVLRGQRELDQILVPLDKEAERIVQRCVRDVALAVVLSPFRSIDLLIVLYRNGQMIIQLAQHYQTRPTAREQIRIFRDVIAIVATVNILNFSEKFIEQLFAGTPLIGPIAGDLTQGAGAGILTSVAGHAAIDRCRCVDPWSRRATQSKLEGLMPRFLADVKAIIDSDVVPRIRIRVPGLEKVSEAISTAYDAASRSVGNWLSRPVPEQSSASGGEVTTVGSTLREQVSEHLSAAGSKSAEFAASTKRGALSALERGSNALDSARSTAGRWFKRKP